MGFTNSNEALLGEKKNFVLTGSLEKILGIFVIQFEAFSESKINLQKLSKIELNLIL
jgi:hypothetical protein